MTRQEFIDNIDTVGELIDFCYEYDCDECEDIYSEDAMDDYINECLTDWARNNTWRDLMNILNDLPTGYDYYRQDDYGDWQGVDDYGDFDDYKQRVLEWGDDNEVWDAEDEEEEEELEEEPTDPDPEEEFEPDFSLSELYTSSVTVFQVSVAQAAAEQEARALAEREAVREDERDAAAFLNQLFTN